MKKRKNGFTLVELLGVVVILSVLVAITTPSVLKALEAGKNSSYDIMVDNIVTASKMYYEECKYGAIYNAAGTRITCNDSATMSLQDLLDIGYLSGVKNENCAGTSCKSIIKDPKTNADISGCRINIAISRSANGKVTYVVRSLTTGNNCPTNTYQHNGSNVLGVTN